MRRFVPAMAAAVLLGSAGLAQADECTIELAGNDQMRFDKESVTVSSSCETITIKLEHTGELAENVMGHNVVISKTEDYQALAQDAVGAGLDNEYVPPDDDRVIAHTEIIGGGESTTAEFSGGALEAGGSYTFFCSFPGHWTLMKGSVVVE